MRDGVIAVVFGVWTQLSFGYGESRVFHLVTFARDASPKHTSDWIQYSDDAYFVSRARVLFETYAGDDFIMWSLLFRKRNVPQEIERMVLGMM